MYRLILSFIFKLYVIINDDNEKSSRKADLIILKISVGNMKRQEVRSKKGLPERGA